MSIPTHLELPWLAEPLRHSLAAVRAHHALLIHGPHGVGQFELALALGQAWLCEVEDESATRPCAHCASCRLVQARSHPDLLALLPEVLQEALGFGTGESEAPADSAKSARKPSKDIKVDAVRQAVAFAQTSSARGRAKVVLVFPADRLNAVAANALLKTLEEPPGLARFVLATGAPDRLLPTVRSRCQSLLLQAPAADEAVPWLAQQGVDHPAVLLAATGGRPLEAKAWADEGLDAQTWSGLPAQVLRGDVGSLPAWPVPRVIEALQKLCHDALLASAGVTPRYFTHVPAAEPAALHAWARALQRAARHAEHPLNAGLLVESLVLQGSEALDAKSGARPPSLHFGHE